MILHRFQKKRDCVDILQDTPMILAISFFRTLAPKLDKKNNLLCSVKRIIIKAIGYTQVSLQIS